MIKILKDGRAGNMKKKLRRQLKDFYQIGNYIYADLMGRIQLVVPRNERINKLRIYEDYQTLIIQYGFEAANNYLKYISNYLK